MTDAEVIAKLRDLWDSADNERLCESDKAHAEAAKWKAEGDMYGWNFHEGRAGGMTWASIYFYRLKKLLDEAASGKVA